MTDNTHLLATHLRLVNAHLDTLAELVEARRRIVELESEMADNGPPAADLRYPPEEADGAVLVSNELFDGAATAKEAAKDARAEARKPKRVDRPVVDVIAKIMALPPLEWARVVNSMAKQLDLNPYEVGNLAGVWTGSCHRWFNPKPNAVRWKASSHNSRYRVVTTLLDLGAKP
jgi:hypothetical protein